MRRNQWDFHHSLIHLTDPVALRPTAGKAVDVYRIGSRHQRTLAAPAEVSGVGFVTGAAVRLRFLPAGPDSGVRFTRTDRPGRPSIPAHASKVSGTARRTTLGPADTGVTLVEHVLAALAGLRIDNCTIEIDGPEPPGLDGSAQGFVDALHSAGIVLQTAQRPIWATPEPITLAQDGATVTIHPVEPGDDKNLKITYFLDYGLTSPIARQTHTMTVTPEAFTFEAANCRTFLLETEAHALRSQGVGKHLTAKELLVFGPRGPLENRLRFANEPARHKVLDLVGDLALCGFDLAGHVVAYRSGHALNVAMAKVLSGSARTIDATPPITRSRAA